MKTIKIIEERKTLQDFNKRNCTTHPASCYVGVRVLDDGTDHARLQFRHVNGVGQQTWDGPQLRGTSVDGSYLD